MNDPFVGTLTFARIYSGKLETASQVTNSVKDKKEKVGRMLLMHANEREDIQVAYAGDIVALAGLKDTTTGDTLCAMNAPIILERMEFPEPVIELSVEPKTKADQEKMGVALNRLAREDPSFRVSSDAESGQTIIKGMGELHLEILVDRMKREFKVEANVGAPQVAYREYLKKPVDVDYTHKKQSGGTGQFGRVKVKVTPGERGSGIIFKDEIKGGNIPKEYIPAIEKGFRETAATGSLVGFPIIDFEINLYDGAYHDVDSSALAFEICARGAMREVAQKSGITLLEPIMKVEVVTPEDYLGDVIGDMNSRRGQIQGTDSARQRADGRGDGPAGQHVRLRELAAFVHAGPRELLDAVLALRRSAAERGRRSEGEAGLRRTGLRRLSPETPQGRPAGRAANLSDDAGLAPRRPLRRRSGAGVYAKLTLANGPRSRGPARTQNSIQKVG